jgi:hypothetical protein
MMPLPLIEDFPSFSAFSGYPSTNKGRLLWEYSMGGRVEEGDEYAAA